jgi:hypothetical protein
MKKACLYGLKLKKLAGIFEASDAYFYVFSACF